MTSVPRAARAEPGAGGDGLLTDLRGELHGTGLRATRQRMRILAALDAYERPAGALEVHHQLHEAGHDVGLVTVYRALHGLAEAGRLHTFVRAGQTLYRRCRTSRHQHLICEGCGMVVEHPMPARHRIGYPGGDFLVCPIHTDVYGLCAQCRPAGEPHHHLDSGRC